MKGKGALWLWIGVLVAFLAGSSFVGYKLYKRHQRQEQWKLAAENQLWEVRSEMTLAKPLEGEELNKFIEAENERMDRYEVVRPVVDELDLIGRWGVEDADAAMAKLRECTIIRPGDQPGTVIFIISDKDKELIGELAQAVGKSYKAMNLRERLLPPMPPGGAGE